MSKIKNNTNKMVHHLSRVENIEFTITQAKYFTIHQGNPPTGTTTSKLVVTRTQETPTQVQFGSKGNLVINNPPQAM